MGKQLHEFICPWCGDLFLAFELLEQHLREWHTIGKEEF
jgi:hypothetical protein